MQVDTKKDLTKTSPETSQSRNEANPGQISTGTSTGKEIDAESDPEVREALNESQI